jgi:hypothetical protein
MLKCKELGMIQIDPDYTEVRSMSLTSSDFLPIKTVKSEEVFMSDVSASDKWADAELELEFDLKEFKKFDLK